MKKESTFMRKRKEEYLIKIAELLDLGEEILDIYFKYENEDSFIEEVSKINSYYKTSYHILHKTL